jgi:hypothetical protein
MESQPNSNSFTFLHTSAVNYRFFFLMTSWSFLWLFADSTAEKRGFAAQPSKGGASRYIIQRPTFNSSQERSMGRDYELSPGRSLPWPIKCQL